MRSQSTLLKFRGKSWSFRSYVSCSCFLFCFVLIFAQSILLPFPKGESDPGHIHLYFCLWIVPHGQRETISFYNWAINMSHKLLTLNVRGLNSSRKRRQVFRWLHLQRSDIIFLQETYSSTETIKRWEAEWGGKVVASHGTTHSKGVIVLFKQISMSLLTKP